MKFLQTAFATLLKCLLYVILLLVAGIAILILIDQQTSPKPNTNTSPDPMANQTASRPPRVSPLKHTPVKSISYSPYDGYTRLRELERQPDRVFDLREETYKLANLAGISLADIQFQEGDHSTTSADGVAVHAAAFAQPSFSRGQRFCSIRVIRPSGDQAYAPGAPTNALRNLRRRVTLAHELGHCVDWYQTGLKGWSTYAQDLLPPTDGIALPDQQARWKEEFADLYATKIIAQAYGREVASDAVQLLVFDRQKTDAVWYRHSWIPLKMGNALEIATPQDAHRLIASHWNIPAIVKR